MSRFCLFILFNGLMPVSGQDLFNLFDFFITFVPVSGQNLFNLFVGLGLHACCGQDFFNLFSLRCLFQAKLIQFSLFDLFVCLCLLWARLFWFAIPVVDRTYSICLVYNTCFEQNLFDLVYLVYLFLMLVSNRIYLMGKVLYLYTR